MEEKTYFLNTGNEEDSLTYAHLMDTLPNHSSVIEEHDTHDVFYQKWMSTHGIATVLKITKSSL